MKERIINTMEVIFEALVEFVLCTVLFIVISAIMMAAEMDGMTAISIVGEFITIVVYAKLIAQLVEETEESLKDIRRA